MRCRPPSPSLTHLTVLCPFASPFFDLSFSPNFQAWHLAHPLPARLDPGGRIGCVRACVASGADAYGAWWSNVSVQPPPPPRLVAAAAGIRGPAGRGRHRLVGNHACSGRDSWLAELSRHAGLGYARPSPSMLCSLASNRPVRPKVKKRSVAAILGIGYQSNGPACQRLTCTC